MVAIQPPLPGQNGICIQITLFALNMMMKRSPEIFILKFLNVGRRLPSFVTTFVILGRILPAWRDKKKDSRPLFTITFRTKKVITNHRYRFHFDQVKQPYLCVKPLSLILHVAFLEMINELLSYLRAY